jgi:hypothetical protein
MISLNLFLCLLNNKCMQSCLLQRPADCLPNHRIHHYFSNLVRIHSLLHPKLKRRAEVESDLSSEASLVGRKRKLNSHHSRCLSSLHILVVAATCPLLLSMGSHKSLCSNRGGKIKASIDRRSTPMFTRCSLHV